MEALNKKAWGRFLTRCRGANLHEVHLRRKENPGAVEIHYNARDPRSGRNFTETWTIGKEGRSTEEVRAKEQAFVDLLVGEDFVITTHDGFEDVDLELGAAAEAEE